MAANVPNYDFDAEEEAHGVRFNYNTFPVTRNEEETMVVPLGLVYNPMKSDPVVLPYTETLLKCIRCEGYLNLHCYKDFVARTWTCCFCDTINRLDSNANSNSIAADNDHVASFLQTTPSSAVLLYLIDLNTEKEELEHLVATITEEAQLLPQNSLFGLVTYDSNVYIHQSTFRKFAFKGDKIIDLVKLFSLQHFQDEVALSTFFTGKDEFLAMLKLLKSSFIDSDKRSERAQGVAMSISIQLLRLVNTKMCHLLAFISGPGTIGPGAITTVNKANKIRTFNDILKAGKLKSDDFYSNIINDSNDEFSIHLFISSYDQIGLFELKELSMKTNGVIIMIDSFQMNLFKFNYKKFYELDIISKFQLKVITSKHLQISGFLNGMLVKKNKETDQLPKYSNISDEPIGHGLSNEIKLNYLNKSSHLNMFFKMKSVAYAEERRSMSSKVYIQFVKTYHDLEGNRIKSIHTIERKTTNSSGLKLENDFDQEACVVLITKLLLFKLLNGNYDIVHKIPNILKTNYLFKFMKNFGIFIKSESSSFKLFENFQQLPNFFYNLIFKSPILSFFNNSPDEFIYNGLNFMNLSTNDSILMIQPILLSYNIEKEEPEPIPLDLRYFKDDEIILMDSFTHILIHYGKIVQHWNETLDHEEYSHVFEFINQSKLEAIDILAHRFPLSRFIITNDGDSQDRFLKSKLNFGIHTDDLTINKFYMDLVDKICSE